MIKLVQKIIFAILALVAVGCGEESKYISAQGTMIGTNFMIKADLGDVASSADLYALAMQVDTIAKSSMSVFDPSSRLSRINANLSDSADVHIEEVLKLAKKIWKLSDGSYDVTVKPLVEAWGFINKSAEANPNIDSILQFVGNEKIDIVDHHIVKSDPRVALDFNSIAKGYTVDMIASKLEEMGSQNYIVDIGGEIACRGVNHLGVKWRVGVETPFDGNNTVGEYLIKRIEIDHGGMATSGNYRRFHLDSLGNKIAHTIDPKSGRSSISKLLSATVVARNCAEADALGTMFMAMGDRRSIELVESCDSLSVYFILAGNNDDEYVDYISPRMEKMIMGE